MFCLFNPKTASAESRISSICSCNTRPIIRTTRLIYYTHRLNEVERWIYWFPAVRSSVRLLTKIMSALYRQQYSMDPFHIYTSYEAECMLCVNVIAKTFNLSFLTWDPIWINSMGSNGAAGYSQNAGVLVALVVIVIRGILTSGISIECRAWIFNHTHTNNDI